MKTPREIRFEKLYNLIEKSKSSLIAQYSETIIRISDADKWDYAIPNMYLNYQDGFIFQRCDSYRSMPLFILPNGTTLYLRWEVNFFSLQDGECEKYLCFDRNGKKYTVIIEDANTKEAGNPSYFRFLPKVEKYRPRSEKKRRA